MLRLALRDASRHRGRSLLALAVIAVPIALVLVLLSSMTPVTTDRESALAELPAQADGTVTATASASAVQQLPERVGPWIDAEDRRPAGPEEIAAGLPEDARLLEWWNSPSLLLTTELDLDPGEQARASTATAVEDLEAASLSTLTLHEAAPEALAQLLPELASGTIPSGPEEIVLSRDAAETRGLQVGDTMQLLAPPDTGWRSTDGRIGAVMEDSARGYVVVGIAEDTGSQAWALPEWVAPAVAADPLGVSRHFLLMDGAEVTWQQVRDLNADGVAVISRAVLEDYPPRSELPRETTDASLLASRIVLAALALGGVSVLLILLVTPAMTIGAERMRHSLALLVVAGARPRHVALVQLGQGALLGLIGSALGVLLALGGIPVLRVLLAGGPTFGPLPWRVSLLLLLAGPLLGVGASLPPARAAARLDPVEALAVRRPSAGSRRRSPAAALAAGLLAVAGAAILLLAPTAPDPLSLILLLPGALLLLLGGLLLIPGLFGAAEALGSALPGASMLRLAARDAARHLGRTAPAAAALLVCTALLVLLATTTASFRASRDLESNSMVAPGRAAIGMETPISEEVDRALIGSVLEELESQGLVADHRPVSSSADGTWIEATPAPNRSCPDGEGPDILSAVDPDAPLHCVPEEAAYAPSRAFPTWLGNELFIIAPEDLRETGFDGAEHAADTLAAGGAVVNDATRLSADGTIELTRSDTGESRTVPGAFLTGFDASVAISPETAREWGVETRYVGEIILPAHALDAGDLEALRSAAQEITPVVTVSGNPAEDRLGLTDDRSSVLFLCAAGTALAVLAALLSMALGRHESATDLAILQSVGATPSQRRRYGVMQAVALVLAGIPPGLLVGGLVSGALVATGMLGAFLVAEVHLLLLALCLAALVALVGLGAAVLTRPRG
ncbi:FtsX-like permease family protein [Brachybacterium sp. J144]|uniref:FtsX-like permease family protein n=1 Tax=Brachybacterium sp. J144 TaxID=3116487 RepID=UPI002E776D7B|nr:FtsX-like permease family protein [Brachybacterium sp. J144]MEE1651469.1 FtsX-like permease family protein [Brachybacterium sp. J144]